MVGIIQLLPHLQIISFIRKLIGLPTSAIVCIEFDTDKWENVMNAEKRAKFVITPRLLKEKTKR